MAGTGWAGNFLGGNATFTSSDDTLTISGGPAEGQINFTAGPAGALNTLAKIYNFGLTDNPAVDNNFIMPTGELLFQSTPPGPSFAFPAVSWFESVTTPADGRVGAWLTTRFQAPGNQSTTFDSDQVYRADYAGSLIDGTEWIESKGLLTSQTSPLMQTGDEYWRHSYLGNNFFGAQPLSNPSAGLAGGIMVEETDQLYVHGSGVIGLRPVRTTNGWGQDFQYTLPQLNGITPAFVGVMNTGGLGSDLAGDGTGIWFLVGDPAHRDFSKARGGYEAAQLTTDINGAWGLDLRAFDGAGNFNVVAHFDNTGATVLGSHVTSLIVSPQIDFTVVADTTIVPAMPGFVLIPAGSTAGLRITVDSGSAATAPTISVGNNATKSNIAAAQNGIVVPIVGPFPWFNNLGQVSGGPTNAYVDLATPIVAHVTIGATGGPMIGRLTLMGTIVPIASIS